MKTKAIFCIFALVLGACSKTGGNASGTATTDTVPASDSTQVESGITVPVIPVENDSACLSNYLFAGDICQLKATPDGKPVILTVDSLGFENPKGVKHVEKLVKYCMQIKKGEKYYDQETDSMKIASEDSEVISMESYPYRESYDFDADGRLTRYRYCTDEILVSFDYRHDGTFSYNVTINENDTYPNIKVNGSWDGCVWKEEVFDWDYGKKQFKPGESFTLEKLSGHPGFFVARQVDNGKNQAIYYRRNDGHFIKYLTPGETLSTDQMNPDNRDDKLIRTDKDSHGNYLHLKEYDYHNSRPDITYKITYR